MIRLALVAGAMTIMTMVGTVYSQGYRDALTKSILFFEGQRSGYLPSSQRLTWRKNSGLQDGKDAKVRELLFYIFSEIVFRKHFMKSENLRWT